MPHTGLRSLPALAALAAMAPLHAQLPSAVDISMAHDEQAHQLNIRLRANDAAFSQVLSNIVFTIRWPESSPATLGVGSSAWCPPPSSAFQCAPSAMISPGNGYKYRTWTSIGLAQLGDLPDDGGCGQALPADDWVQVLSINVNNDPGGTLFEIADDAYAEEENRSFYLSLNGLDRTGGIFNFSTGLGEAATPCASPALALSPNPASARVQVSFPGEYAGSWEAAIMDASGRFVLQTSGTGLPGTVDLGALSPGPYHLRLRTAHWEGTAHLIVEQ